MTEVLLLGTGAADGWPNPFCRCASCTAARSQSMQRSPTAALVDDVILLDCGPEAARAAGRAGRVLDRVHTVLLTHEHPDHCDPAFLLWRSWSKVTTPLVVAGPPAAIEMCRHWRGPHDPVELRVVRPGDTFRAGEHEVRVLAANHEPGAVLYDLTGPDRARLLYATDTGALPESTTSACADRRYDLVMLEETFGDAGHLGDGHHDLPTFAQTVAELCAVGAVADRTTVLAIHLGHHNPAEPELSRRLGEIGAQVVPDLTVLDVTPGDGARVQVSGPRPRRVVVTGGARSGKSAAAEVLVGFGRSVTYVATAPTYDDVEWEQRVAAHRARRPAHWSTVELGAAAELAVLLRKADTDDVLLVDCLTLWLTRLVDEHDAWEGVGSRESARSGVDAEVDELLDAWRTTQAVVVLVTNEVGSGIVPPTASGRYLRDLLGATNARLAAHADEVRLVVAGRTVALT